MGWALEVGDSGTRLPTECVWGVCMGVLITGRQVQPLSFGCDAGETPGKEFSQVGFVIPL